MWTQLKQFVAGLPIGIILLIVVASTVVSLGLLFATAVALPSNYFANERPPRPQNKVLSVLTTIGLNVLGLVLVLLGVLLSLPGIPGQGILTIFVGLLLMDLPGKRALERKLLSKPQLMKLLNGVRYKFRRPPLTLPR